MGPQKALMPSIELVALRKGARISGWSRKIPQVPRGAKTTLSTFLLALKNNLAIVYVDRCLILRSMKNSPMDAFLDLPSPIFWLAMATTAPEKSDFLGYLFITSISAQPPSDPPMTTGGSSALQYFILMLYTCSTHLSIVRGMLMLVPWAGKSIRTDLQPCLARMSACILNIFLQEQAPCSQRSVLLFCSPTMSHSVSKSMVEFCLKQPRQSTLATADLPSLTNLSASSWRRMVFLQQLSQKDFLQSLQIFSLILAWEQFR